MNYDVVLWDWNGTLLNDVAFSLELLNYLLVRHGYAPLSGGLNAYRQVFRFPVSEYYQKVGFDFSRTPYEQLAQEYMALYEARSQVCDLQPGARTTVEALADMGIIQVVLSASEREILLRQLLQYRLTDAFDQVLGLDNIWGRSKAQLGREWMAQSGLQPKRALMIGDSVHDWETACAMGADCILYSGGHQAKGFLTSTGAPVIDHLGELVHLVKV